MSDKPKNSRDLTQGSVPRHLTALTLPMVGGLFATFAFNLADTYFVGQLGTDQLAAMSFTFPVVMIALNLTIGLGAGTSSVIARAVGENDPEKTRRLTTHALILGLITVAVFSTIGMLTIEPLFKLLGAEDHLIPLIADYMMVWYPGGVFMVTSMLTMSAIRATGDAKLPGIVMVGAAILNMILDPLLIFGLWGLPRLELTGAAIATLLARGGAGLLGLHVLHRQKHMLAFEIPKWEQLSASWQAILHVGLPAMGTNMIIPVCNGVIVALIASHGANAVAAYGIANRVEAVALIFYYSTSAIIGPFTGQNLGARLFSRIHQAQRTIFVFSLVLGLAVALVLGPAGSWISGFFSTDVEVIKITAAYLWIVPVSYGFYGVVMNANASFNGMGKPIPGMWISLFRMAVLYLPIAYLGNHLMGLNGIFGASAFANVVMGVAAWMIIGRALPREDDPQPAT